MVPKTCSIPECEKPSRKRTWCNSHYMNWFRHGDPLTVAHVASPEERFWASVDTSGSCWKWTEDINDSGYGIIRIGKKSVRAHRFAWELLVDEIPEGMQIDHRCRHRECVRPEHLRVVTNKQNQEHISMRSTNTSGYRSVTFNKRRNKWAVLVGHNGRNYFGGNFSDVHEAGAAAKELRNELFTHNDLDRNAA